MTSGEGGLLRILVTYVFSYIERVHLAAGNIFASLGAAALLPNYQKVHLRFLSNPKETVTSDANEAGLGTEWEGTGLTV